MSTFLLIMTHRKSSNKAFLFISVVLFFIKMIEFNFTFWFEQAMAFE